jgi:hypothetical protein
MSYQSYNNNNSSGPSDGIELSLSSGPKFVQKFSPLDLFGQDNINFFNIIKSLHFDEIIAKINTKCPNDFTLTFEFSDVYDDHGIIKNRKIIKKQNKNRGFNKSLLFNTKKNRYNSMILCLNKKYKNKNTERKCLSSIIIWYSYCKTFDTLKISIDSKTNTVYEGRKYNKLLRILIIMILYEYHIIYGFKLNGKKIKNIYIESQAINPISAYLLLQLGFKINIFKNDEDNFYNINSDLSELTKIDLKLTDEFKSFNFEEFKIKFDDKPFYNMMYLFIFIQGGNENIIINEEFNINLSKKLNELLGDNKSKSIKCLKNNNINNSTQKNNNNIESYHPLT